MDKIVFCIIAALVGVITYGVYDELTADKFSLRKDQFECTMSHIETSTNMVDVGGGNGTNLMPVTSNHSVCDMWKRK